MIINKLYQFLKKPLVAGVSTFIVLLIITQFIAYQKYRINNSEQQQILNQEISFIKEKLQFLIMFNYSATKSLAYIVERNGIPDDFDAIAIDLLEHQSYFDAVELVDSTGVITHVYPKEGNPVLGFNILSSKEGGTGAHATIQRKDFFIAGPVNLKQGGVGIISRQPIYIEDKFHGFTAVVTKLSTFFNDLEINHLNDSQFEYQLSKVNGMTGEESYFLDSNLAALEDYAVPIKIPSGEWKLYIMPKGNRTNSAYWFSVLGFLLAGFAGWGTWYFIGTSDRFNRLIKIKLDSQEAQLKFIHETTKHQIRKSEASLNKAQEIASLGSWELDLKTNKITWSEEMYRIFEKDLDSYNVTRKGVYDTVHPEDRIMVRNIVDEAIENKHNYQVTYRLLLSDERIKYIDEQCELYYDEDNIPIKLFGTIQDITERIIREKELLNFKINLENIVSKRTEELNDSKEALLNLVEDINEQTIELEKEKMKAQSADLMKSAFLATMSHELRTPMNSIIGFTGILLKELAGPLNKEQKKQLSMVERSGQNLLRLINDVLDISKIEAGKLNVSYEPFNYLVSIHKTIDFLKPQVDKKGLTIITQIEDKDIVIDSDERRIEQVLLNLISNAIKFSDKGIITVKVDVKDSNVVTQVIDEGIGVSAKDIDKLFEPFTQLEDGLNRKQEGTGLGLTISKSLIEKLGGTIFVCSELDTGSKFTFSLPLKKK
ncbi:ATP-binding protein [uncultured Winogradskyella sp.]|uniref:sensor histidine kinase n=1 Tax=Winogradskyella sp. 4-2091 TaxID=3381659 RepID=UPI00262FC851|nr:ATP-binding protein [uncultured Winogradskyella sp.]